MIIPENAGYVYPGPLTQLIPNDDGGCYAIVCRQKGSGIEILAIEPVPSVSFRQRWMVAGHILDVPTRFGLAHDWERTVYRPAVIAFIKSRYGPVPAGVDPAFQDFDAVLQRIPLPDVRMTVEGLVT